MIRSYPSFYWDLSCDPRHNNTTSQAKIDFDHPSDIEWILKPESERRGDWEPFLVPFGGRFSCQSIVVDVHQGQCKQQSTEHGDLRR